MDSIDGDKNVTELFGEKYNELYISINNAKGNFLTLQNENGYNIEMYCTDDNDNDNDNEICLYMLNTTSKIITLMHTITNNMT